MFTQKIRNGYYETLGTSVINSPWKTLAQGLALKLWVLILNFDCLVPEYQCPNFLINNLWISYRKWGIFIDLSSIVLFLKIPIKNENLVCNQNKKNTSINAMLKNKILALSFEVHCWALNLEFWGKVRLGSKRSGEGGGGDGILLKCFIYMMHIFEPTLMYPEKYALLCRQCPS